MIGKSAAGFSLRVEMEGRFSDLTGSEAAFQASSLTLDSSPGMSRALPPLLVWSRCKVDHSAGTSQWEWRGRRRLNGGGAGRKEGCAQSLVSTPRSCGLLWPLVASFWKKEMAGLALRCCCFIGCSARCFGSQTATPLQSSLLTAPPPPSPTTPTPISNSTPFIPSFPSPLFFSLPHPTPLFQHHAIDPNQRRRPNPQLQHPTWRRTFRHLILFSPVEARPANAVLAHARTVLVANWPAATQQYTHHPSMTRDQKQMHNQQQRNQVAL